MSLLHQDEPPKTGVNDVLNRRVLARTTFPPILARFHCASHWRDNVPAARMQVASATQPISIISPLQKGC
ncbi:hypothetical protein [Kamptonema sp. UHCC 0994]|uniref:hypothetical protein n=1 Tax=Kamptonema sp. UHCC 0994 TaxID=3031329 RepID=UPI0023BA4A77|nr:hypothetical protein [Kamptonema sp. UHCC 0994]MDF0556664.1 hypothetical protein [Kamptonema sp. UHCC 0994]